MVIFIPKKTEKKLGLLTGKGIKMKKEDAEKLVKKGLGFVKKAPARGRPKKAE